MSSPSQTPNVGSNTGTPTVTSYRVTSMNGQYTSTGPPQPIQGPLGRGNPAQRTAAAAAASARNTELVLGLMAGTHITAPDISAPVTTTTYPIHHPMSTYNPPNRSFRRDLQSRVNKNAKDVVISSTGIQWNNGVFVDTNVNGRNKYQLTTHYHESSYDMAEDLKTMTQADRQNFWSESYVEIEVDMAAISEPNGKDVVQAIQVNISKLKDFTENVKNLFVNLRFPSKSYYPTHDNLFEAPSVSALLHLVEKLNTFKQVSFMNVNICASAEKDAPIQFEWLQNVAAFGDLTFQWHVCFSPGFTKVPKRIPRSEDNHRYINDQYRMLARQRQEWFDVPVIKASSMKKAPTPVQTEEAVPEREDI